MADAALQALLDPDGNGRGIVITDRTDNGGNGITSYYVNGNVYAVGKSLWVDTNTSDSDATKNTTIRAALGVA